MSLCYIFLNPRMRTYILTCHVSPRQDNCEQEAQVKVTVLSNEFEFSHSKTSENMVLIEERRPGFDRHQSHRLDIFVEAKA